MKERQRRLVAMLILCLLVALGAARQDRGKLEITHNTVDGSAVAGVTVQSPEVGLASGLATEALQKLTIKGRAPKTGYSRGAFGAGWQPVGTCDIRNYILARDMVQVTTQSESNCTVLSGELTDPYTGTLIRFSRGPGTSSLVQIDHVVALSDAWQKGAQQLSSADRLAFSNDPLNLLAVEGKANQDKSDGDAATWLPPNKAYRCRYVARQIAVKTKYVLWVTQAEYDAMQRVLETCPQQRLPIVTDI